MLKQSIVWLPEGRLDSEVDSIHACGSLNPSSDNRASKNSGQRGPVWSGSGEKRMNTHLSEHVEFGFAFAAAYRLPAFVFGITPATARVSLTSEELRVRFGPWRLRTPRTNIAGCEVSGGFVFVKTVGPARLSLADHGVTFATNAERAVCVHFHEPVGAIDPWGRLRHPRVTLTVADPDAPICALQRWR